MAGSGWANQFGRPVSTDGILSGSGWADRPKWLFAIPGRPGRLCQPSFQHWPSQWHPG